MDQPTKPDAYDSPWKEILERYFPEFMAFFFPESYAEIDWSRGYESLDQELQQVVRDAESGRRLADKLIKVYRLDGQEQWVLIHVEIQGEHDEGCGQRMYRWKTQLVRALYERGHDQQDVLELLRFIDWVMALPEELAIKFREEHKRFEEELRMRYVTTFERLSRQEGLEQGIKTGEASMLRRLLLRRFEQLPAWVEQRLAQAGSEQLESWFDRVFEAQRLEDVFA